MDIFRKLRLFNKDIEVMNNNGLELTRYYTGNGV